MSFGVGAATNAAAFQVGGALGAGGRHHGGGVPRAGPDRFAALTAGCRAGFATCIVFALIGPAVTLALLGRRPRAAPDLTHAAVEER